MKKGQAFLMAIVIIVAAVGGFFLGKSTCKGNTTAGRTIPEDSASSEQDRVVIQSGEPLNYNDAKSYYDTYTARWDGNAKYRTRALWYNYHNLSEYLLNIEKELRTAGYDTSRIGIKAYVGALPDLVSGYRYRLTTFFVPTIIDRDGVKKDTIDKTVLQAAYKDKRDKLIMFTDGFNHGDLCPPETSCGRTAFD